MKRTAYGSSPGKLLSLTAAVGFMLGSSAYAQQVTLFTEDFQGTEWVSLLGPAADEPPLDDAVWTDTPPSGWVMDDSGIPGAGDPLTDGVTEWAGWAFTRKDWWIDVAGDQRRSEFVNATGAVMVADPDEYDDQDHDYGMYYSALVTTDAIDISTATAGTLELEFDSSWRDEGFDNDWSDPDTGLPAPNTNNQTAVIWVSYDGGTEVEVLRWESDTSSPHFKDDAPNEHVSSVQLNNPAGASTMKLKFGLLNAANDWWWAVDNLAVGDGSTTFFSEDFESSVSLGPAVDEEGPPANTLWTHDVPTGWVNDRSQVPGVGDPAEGVEEWEGWSFARAAWWVAVAGDDGRSDFSNSEDNIVAIADPDEWDDLGNPEAIGPFKTFLSLPEISLDPVASNTARISFKSSWRDEDNQAVNITASYDGGAPVEILRWESDPGSAYFHDDATYEEINISLNAPPNAESVVITFGMIDGGNDWWWAIDDIEVFGQVSADRITLLDEDFDDVPLGSCIDENCSQGDFDPDAVWSSTPPAGWSVDRTGVPGVGDPAEGVTEWEGWNFADANWWSAVAEDQGRSEFTNASGTVAIADPDEWDDLGDPDSLGTFDSFMTTDSIDITGAAENSLTLTFDSSWKDEGNQTATVTVSYDGGAAVEVLRWESQQGTFYHADNTNEAVSVALNNPVGASSMVIEFGMTNAVNNWFWAVDNLSVDDASSNYFTEDFESIVLGGCVDEFCQNKYWTHTPPANWDVDRSQVPGLGDPSNGVTEWEGWCFVDPKWWSWVADDDGRSDFLHGGLASGLVAVVDPDEWDDRGDPEALGPYNTSLTTPAIDITGQAENTLDLVFDSSWRPEDFQTAVVTAAYDGGAAVEVMRWVSDSADPNYKGDATSETVTVPLNNPSGATSVVVSFIMPDGGNDWWWAIDNVRVEGTGGNLFLETFDGLSPLSGPVDENIPSAVNTNVWTNTPPPNWALDATNVPGFGTADDGVTEWVGWGFAERSFWFYVDDQRRDEFTKSTGALAVVDPDEWDDQMHPPGNYEAYMYTPQLSLNGIQPRSVFLTFDSSWRPEDFQTANISVSFDGGSEIELVRWESEDGDEANYKPEATNESVIIPILNPGSADSMQITFGMPAAGNDWWWAIDNVLVFSVGTGNDPIYDYDGDGDVDQQDFAVIQLCTTSEPMTATSPEECLLSDVNGDLLIDITDVEAFDACGSGPDVPADITCDD